MEFEGGGGLYEKQLQCILSHKYLGVIIEDGNCEAHIKRQLMNLYANANTLVRKFGKCSCNVNSNYLECIVQTCIVVFFA